MKKQSKREAIGKLDLKGVVPDVVFDRFSGKGWGRISIHLPSEMALAIYVNRQELVTISYMAHILPLAGETETGANLLC